MLKFMKSGLRQIIAIVPAILLSIIMPAQELPLMPADPSILSGVLPNGMSYYIAPNHTCKGMADFALVQKTGLKNVDGDSGNTVTIAREALVKLPRLGSMPPHRFFSSHGSAPGTEGYVSVRDDATVFRFRDVRLSDGGTVLDSALLVMMDMADRVSFTEDAFLKKWYSPADQAVVVAGDVDPKAVAARLEAMSYMIPAQPSAKRTVPVAEPVEGKTVIAGEASALGTVSMKWVSGRVPREYMNTVQPVIFDMSLEVLGDIAVKRIKYSLKQQGIPYAQVSYRHIGSDRMPYDDVFAVSATVERGQMEETAGIIAGVMEAIDAEGVSPGEYLLAETLFMDILKRQADSPVTGNDGLADKCISAYLYRSSLALAKQVYAFHKSRNLPDTMRCRLFNGVAAALLHPLDTLPAGLVPFAADPADTSGFPGIGPKIKIKSSRRDHLSGGAIWTFSNGFKVVYRNMPSGGDVYYKLALNGGYSGIPDLAEGEGPFLSDIFRLSDIAGMPGDEFKDFLRSCGITMDMRVTMSNTLVQGHLPKERMALLMRSLLALANRRELSEDRFPYYRQCENLSLEFNHNRYEFRRTAIDSIMSPGFRYSPYRSKDRLTGSFPDKADRFLSGQMEKMNDGVFVVVGDIGEEQLKKILLEYVGGFKTSEAAVRRSVIRYQPVSGWSTYTVGGEVDAVDVAQSARMPLTAQNCLAADMAMLFLESRLTEVLAESGMAFELAHDFRIYPEERLNILVSVYEADEKGLASGISPSGSIEVLDKLRGALSDMRSAEITDAAFRNFKAYMKNRIGLNMKDPEYWMNAIAMRYLDGKDVTTGYAANIDAMTQEDVKRVFSLLDKGSKVEYVTIRKN